MNDKYATVSSHIWFAATMIILMVPMPTNADFFLNITNLLSSDTQTDYTFSDTKPVVTSDNFYSLYIYTGFSKPLSQSTTLTFVFNSGQLRFDDILNNDGVRDVTANGQKLSDAAWDNDLFIESFHIATTDDASLYWKIGKQQAMIGNGYILDDYAPAIHLSIRGNTGRAIPHPRIDLGVYKWKNPFINLNLTWRPWQDGTLSLFGAYLRDRGTLSRLLTYTATVPQLSDTLFDPPPDLTTIHDTLSRVDPTYTRDVNPFIEMMTLLEMTSTSHLIWPGMTFTQAFDRADLTVTAIGSLGESTLSYAQYNLDPVTRTRQTPSITHTGYLFSARYDYYLSSRALLSTKYLHASGDANFSTMISDGQTHSFVAVSPFIDHSNFFFNSGIDTTYAEPSLSAIGLNGHGIISPGMSLHILATERFSFLLNTVYLFSEHPNNTRNIGPEFNLEAYYTITDIVSLSFEADLFAAQSYFDETNRSTYKAFILALDIAL